jgi:hypothetical protein
MHIAIERFPGLGYVAVDPYRRLDPAGVVEGADGIMMTSGIISASPAIDNESDGKRGAW